MHLTIDGLNDNNNLKSSHSGRTSLKISFTRFTCFYLFVNKHFSLLFCFRIKILFDFTIVFNS